MTDPETRAMAAERCYCDDLDPRAVEGGARCGTCEARDEVARAEREAADAGDKVDVQPADQDRPDLAPGDSRAEAAERENRRLREALRMIDRRLTTVEGDNVPRGTAAALTAREIARRALSGGATREEQT